MPSKNPDRDAPGNQDALDNGGFGDGRGNGGFGGGPGGFDEAHDYNFIVINGGMLNIDAEGDGIDSNGNLVITGQYARNRSTISSDGKSDTNRCRWQCHCILLPQKGIQFCRNQLSRPHQRRDLHPQNRRYFQYHNLVLPHLWRKRAYEKITDSARDQPKAQLHKA